MDLSIRNNSYNNNYMKINQNRMHNDMQKLSSGKKINSAKDDVAGSAISEKMLQKIAQENARIENYQSEQSKINVADGMNEGVSDYLMDMYEQEVRKGNSLLSSEDRSAITDYQESLKEGAESLLSSTKFNEMSVADDASKAAIPENFDIDSINDSMETFNNIRSKDGAEFNGLEHAINSSREASINTTAAMSRIADTEYGEGVSNLRRGQAIDAYQNSMQNFNLQNAQALMSNMV